MEKINKPSTKAGKPSGDKLSADLIKEPAYARPFGKMNFILMGICLALIIIGFALMAGPGSSVEAGFNPDIFSTRRIVVGPTIAFIGFLCMAFAIIYRPKNAKKDN